MGALVAATGTWTPVIATWPWPQIRFLQYYTLGLAPKGTQLALYELEIIGGSWNATEIMELGLLTDILQVEIMDFGPFFTLSTLDSSDNVQTWNRNPGVAAGVEGAYSELPSTQTPKFISGCNYNGQPVIGGIDSDDASWGDLDHHSIAWAGIGGFDFRISTQATAGYAHTNQGMSGYGQVWRVKKLGNSIVIYTNSGIFSTDFQVSQSPGWSVPADLGKVEPYNCRSIAAGNYAHFYIDKNLKLWKLTKEGFEYLDYKYYVNKLTMDNIHLVYDETVGKLYISDGVISYILTAKGLYQSHQCVTSVGRRRGLLCGFFIDTEDYSARLVSNTLDFNSRGYKTLQCLEMGLTSNDAVTGAIQYKNAAGTFVEPPAKTFTDDGIVFPIISGIDMRVVIETDDYRTAGLEIDYINAKVKYTDKRFRRSANVSN